ncbi:MULTISPECIES: hypothetical protein [Proteus]|uniref:hypothetical protein n=1 Tax=Proteus TaxID=583 RepID=UPI00071DB6E2|nr:MULTISPECIES: hypothetical protein [Proteus]AND13846.1 hypothetical protein AOUC001_13460 [Proteus mirabilis]EKV6228417.1 hypothetical protein [Proteus mirabilis]EKW4660786.1 hypothetical protein [Proteus mirabilis]ELB1684707.1 hypothetical protein [Proteus mirabilis]KSA06013.1 hypothetical protein AC442_11405 [Proteus mirabilis]
MNKCCLCKKELDDYNGYEYRGFHSCEEHFDEVIARVDRKRQEIISQFDSISRPLKGLDISPDNPIGKANRELLKGSLEVCSKETLLEKEYRKGII